MRRGHCAEAEKRQQRKGFSGVAVWQSSATERVAIICKSIGREGAAWAAEGLRGLGWKDADLQAEVDWPGGVHSDLHKVIGICRSALGGCSVGFWWMIGLVSDSRGPAPTTNRWRRRASSGSSRRSRLRAMQWHRYWRTEHLATCSSGRSVGHIL